MLCYHERNRRIAVVVGQAVACDQVNVFAELVQAGILAHDQLFVHCVEIHGILDDAAISCSVFFFGST